MESKSRFISDSRNPGSSADASGSLLATRTPATNEAPTCAYWMNFNEAVTASSVGRTRARTGWTASSKNQFVGSV